MIYKSKGLKKDFLIKFLIQVIFLVYIPIIGFSIAIFFVIYESLKASNAIFGIVMILLFLIFYFLKSFSLPQILIITKKAIIIKRHILPYIIYYRKKIALGDIERINIPGKFNIDIKTKHGKEVKYDINPLTNESIEDIFPHFKFLIENGIDIKFTDYYQPYHHFEFKRKSEKK